MTYKTKKQKKKKYSQKKKYNQKGGGRLSIKALTYNLSWASQKNVALGSEDDFVGRCITIKRNCYNEALKQVEDLHKIHNFDIIGIQEVEDPELVTKIINLTKLQGFYRGATWNSLPKANIYSGCAIFWNTKKLGSMKSCKTINLATPRAEDNLCDGRTCCVVTTTENIHLIVAHFPWINNQEDIDKISKIMNTHISPDGPIIILADTNDSKTLISSENPLIVQNKALSHGLTKTQAQARLNSCCWHEVGHKYGHFNTTGDYILSEYVQDIKIPIATPSNNSDEQNLYSDHMPVIATVIINITRGISTLQRYKT